MNKQCSVVFNKTCLNIYLIYTFLKKGFLKSHLFSSLHSCRLFVKPSGFRHRFIFHVRFSYPKRWDIVSLERINTKTFFMCTYSLIHFRLILHHQSYKPEVTLGKLTNNTNANFWLICGSRLTNSKLKTDFYLFEFIVMWL